MNEKLQDAAYAELVLETMGLEETISGDIVDPDFGNIIMIAGKALKSLSVAEIERNNGAGVMEFNPLKNVHLMQKLLTYFIKKREPQLSIIITSFYPIYTKGTNKKVYELRYKPVMDSIQGPEQVISSHEYRNDSLCLYELMKSLAGERFEGTFEEFDYIE
mgnify:CR=1 FL=1